MQIKAERKDFIKQMEMMNPTPETCLQKKFDYFYASRDFVCNTRKFLTAADLSPEIQIQIDA